MWLAVSDMDEGTIDVTWIPQLYWIIVGSAIALLTLVNVFNYLQYRQRLRAMKKRRPDPARPHNILMSALTGFTALTRETSNFSLPSLPRKANFFGWRPPSPSFGSCFLVAANVIILLILGFYKLEPNDYNNYQNIAYRWGFLTLGQFPLLFLLAGKENILGFFTGHSYERLNWLHRWVARCMFLTATLHMGFWFGDWAPYDYIGYQIQNDHTFTQTGFAAWCILLWIVVSSSAPFRALSYEFFVVQHIVTFAAFVAMVFIHIPSSDHTWLWVPVALFFFDRCVRWFWMLFNNLAVFHPQRDRQTRAILACQAEMRPLPGRMTRVTIRNPPITWKAGQHLYLSSLSLLPFQSHPFSITSLPSDDKLEFLIKAHRGGTRRFFDLAEKRSDLPVSTSKPSRTSVTVMISDPYGSVRPLRQFDSVILFAGSTGAGFTVPLLREIVRQWKSSTGAVASNGSSWLDGPSGAVTRRIRFVWAVKSGEHMSWFAAQLHEALLDVEKLRSQGLDVGLSISVYVTCDEAFTADWSSTASSTSEAVIEKDVSSSKGNNIILSGKTVDDKKGMKMSETNVVEIDPRSGSIDDSSSGSAKGKACQPDGTCCCQTVVTDERTAPSYTCKCAGHTDAPLQRLPSLEKDPVAALAPLINIVSGRPHPRTITRQVLERARGESAVVACGPQGLNNDVRRAVVGLSDERAIGRETGALGVWFWGEGFGL